MTTQAKQQTDSAKIPRLRFCGLEGAWEEKKLGVVKTFVTFIIPKCRNYLA